MGWTTKERRYAAMIHEIMPDVMDNQYRNRKPEGDSRVLFVRGQEILVCGGAEGIAYPRYGDVAGQTDRKSVV